MAKKAYVVKKFRRESILLIQKINDIIQEYAEQGYSLTLRQVYYQLVARDIIANNERSYKNLGNLISEGRLAGEIDWYAIEDRTRNLKSRSKWESPAEIIVSAAYSYHRDYWEEQAYYVEVWVEKDALVGIVGQVCTELDVNFFSCRGYVSQSEMWGAAERLKRRQKDGKEIVILHLGDHDPSGKDMSRDIVERLQLFEVSQVEFHRLALNYEQIEKYNPPPNPTKLSDSRAQGYIQEYGYSCWELDALEPKIIRSLIEENVKKYRDEKIYKLTRDREEREIMQLQTMADNWDVFERKIEELY